MNIGSKYLYVVALAEIILFLTAVILMATNEHESFQNLMLAYLTVDAVTDNWTSRAAKSREET